MKKYLLIALASLAIFRASVAQIMINEYSCANRTQYADNNAKYEDWIELYNAGAKAVNLDGYYLSDKQENPLKWQFPSGVSIAAGGFQRIWCSGRGMVSGAHIHASFHLTQSKDDPDFIILSDASGGLLDEVQIQRHQLGHSWGRKTNGSSTWAVFTLPTLNASNNTATPYERYAVKPQASIEPGNYKQKFTVYFTTTEPNSVIRYTKDGSFPTAASPLYVAANGVKVDSTCTVVKAVTISNNGAILRSFAEINTYFINALHTLPVISISGYQLDILANGDQSKRPPGSFEFFDRDWRRKAFSYGSFNSHGQDSWANDQRSLDYKTHDEDGYDYAIRERLFSLSRRDEFQGIIIRAAGDDNYPAAHHASNEGSAHIRDAYVQNMAIQGGLNVDVRTAEKAIVYLNGKYWGVYDMRERADEHDYTKYYYNQDKYNIQYILTWGGTWSEYGGGQSITDWNSLRNTIMSANTSNDSVFRWIEARLDAKSLADYVIVNSVAVCSDWLNYNTGWWRGKSKNGGHQRWGYTLWDDDATFGFYINYTGVPDTGAGAKPCNVETGNLNDPEGHIDLLQKLRLNKRFNQWYISRYIDLSNTIYSQKSMLDKLDSTINLLKPEMTQHAKRWFGTYNEWYKNAQRLRYFVYRRTNAMPNGINQCYNTGGPYKTTFDVQPAGAGEIQVNSLRFKDFPYTGNYYSKIDTYLKGIPNKGYEFDYWVVKKDTIKPNTATWDAILRVVAADTVVAHFKVKTDIVRLNFTEVNYDNDFTRNSGSWFELSNYGNAGIDLSGWKITSGSKWKEYIFPGGSIVAANSRWVFVSDSARFARQYGTVANVVYVNFDLSSRKEALRLWDTIEVLMLDLPFDNNQPWPIAADGAGRPLHLLSDSADCSNPANWRNGCVGGSPGYAFAACHEPLVVSEINYNPAAVADAGDWIELHNTGNAMVDLSNYRLRTKNNRPVYTFPAGTTLAAGAYLVVAKDSAAFIKVHASVANFIIDSLLKLDNAGDFVRLYNAADTLVFSVAYEDNGAFTPKADGNGFTLEYNASTDDFSNGKAWSANCYTGSPGSGPGSCEGGILFTEINVKSAPFNDAGDWIELKNSSPNSYSLAGWSISDSSAGGFVLPSITLNPQQYIVLAADSVKFSRAYPWVKNVVGNLNFNLSSAGEKLRIFNASQKLVNVMEYGDTLPWPGLVSGFGYTMEIKDTNADPSTGTNWFRGCLGGSPGEAYTPCYDSVVVAEFNYNSHPKANAGDWVELWNRGSQTVDMSDWLFQDDNAKDSFMIAAGTVLQPGKRLVLANDTVKMRKIFSLLTDMQGNFSFGLSSGGDMLKLKDADGRLRFGMQFNTDSTWPQAANGASYTLELAKDSFTYSDKRYWTTACPAGSPGKPRGACEGQVAFSEMNYRSETGMNTGDWAELMNPGTIPTDLNNCTVTNADSSKTYKLITDRLLFGGEYRVLACDTAKFDSYHSDTLRFARTMLVDMADAGGRLRLVNPNKVLLAAASFSPSATWPSPANGQGKTLERVSTTLDPDLPSTWFAGCYGGSPGGPFQACDRGVVVSEINYEPATAFNTGKWIELFNTLTSATSLDGYAVANGSTTWHLPAGLSLASQGRIVLAADTSAFAASNPGISYIYCPINWQKNDVAKIYKPSGSLDFYGAYSNQSPWPQQADGKGHTLEAIDSATDYTLSTAWFEGCYGGSPAAAWSACSSPVIVSEINYQSNMQADAGDWLELLNSSKLSQDISGWKLTAKNSAATYTIPAGRVLKPGGRIVLANNAAVFSKLFPAVVHDTGLFALPPTEELTLTDASGRWLFTFTYANSSGWPAVFGNSYTLERVTYGDASLGSSWFKGCPCGSPGTAYQPCTGQLVFSEINYNSHGYVNSGDWIELMNTGNIPVLPAGFLLVNGDSTSVYPIQSTELIYPGSRLVLCESKTVFEKIHNITNLEGGTGINLKAAGENVTLYDAGLSKIAQATFQNGNGWPEIAGTGRSIEYTNGNPLTPAGWMHGCIGGSPGVQYSACKYPLVVSEINYNSSPLMNTGDWVELHNTTAVNINLNGYTLKAQGMNFTFSSSHALPANGYLVMYADSAFNTWWNAVSNKQQVAGLALDNGDKMDILDATGKLLFYVNFQTGTPWPAEPNGSGRTLELSDSAINPTLGSAWFGGCFGGSPGKAYQLPCDYNGIAYKHLEQIALFPNPGTAGFTLAMPQSAGISLIHVYDAQGKLMQTGQTDGNSYTMDCNGLAKGVYLIQVNNSKSVSNFRWIKE